uniref:Uncharacterized protein n=1 Tax=Arundo donax TaxID=35708 RepID=A0A0A8Z768_ARUDO
MPGRGPAGFSDEHSPARSPWISKAPLVVLALQLLAWPPMPQRRFQQLPQRPPWPSASRQPLRPTQLT